MKRACLVSVIALFILCSSGLANADLITQNFYIKITSMSTGPSLYDPNEYYDPAAALAAFPSTYRVGNYVSGSVTYNNSLIPSIGSYIIGGAGWGTWSGPNEYQDWTITYGGMTNYGFIIGPATVYPELYFVNGVLTAIYAEYNADLIYGLQSEYLRGNRASAVGTFLYDAWIDDCGWVNFDASFNMEGDFYLGSAPSVPETHVIFLLGTGLIGIACFRKAQEHNIKVII